MNPLSCGISLLFNDLLMFLDWKKPANTIEILSQDNFGQYCPTSIKCKGEINFVEAITVPSIDKIDVPPTHFVQPPGDLKRRHPFFGLELHIRMNPRLPTKLTKTNKRENKKKLRKRRLQRKM